MGNIEIQQHEFMYAMYDFLQPSCPELHAPARLLRRHPDQGRERQRGRGHLQLGPGQHHGGGGHAGTAFENGKTTTSVF